MKAYVRYLSLHVQTKSNFIYDFVFCRLWQFIFIIITDVAIPFRRLTILPRLRAYRDWELLHNVQVLWFSVAGLLTGSTLIFYTEGPDLKIWSSYAWALCWNLNNFGVLLSTPLKSPFSFLNCLIFLVVRGRMAPGRIFFLQIII